MIKKFQIEIIRYLDQLSRQLTGMPRLKHSEITDKLYLGGQYKLTSFETLKKVGITAIVNMRTKSVHTLPLENFNYLHLPTPDHHAPSQKQLTEGVEFIESQVQTGGKVYIHCRFGEGRGPTMAIAYLVSTGLTLEEAFDSVRKVRPFIRPTLVQIEALNKFSDSYEQKKS
jgi:protein-tyrosine phosphatase